MDLPAGTFPAACARAVDRGVQRLGGGVLGVAAGGRPAALSFVVAFLGALGSFLLLRIADEFKDADEDARYRPYRPVPRGLVQLRELAVIGVAVALLQWLLALTVGWPLVGLLAVTWAYFLLMSREFFARTWLKARPVAYLFSHMLIMPLIDWFATGCDWVRAGERMPAGLFWFLAASFCNGLVIELGRKIRAPGQEEPGVETYTALGGRPTAVAAWIAALLATLGCALAAARRSPCAPRRATRTAPSIPSPACSKAIWPCRRNASRKRSKPCVDPAPANACGLIAANVVWKARRRCPPCSCNAWSRPRRRAWRSAPIRSAAVAARSSYPPCLDSAPRWSRVRPTPTRSPSIGAARSWRARSCATRSRHGRR